MLPDRNTIKLLRIPFSFFLMPVFLFALSQADDPVPGNALICFLVIHLLVYPASNGYNSYIDKDESSIGGLERPPLPTRRLFQLTLLMDCLAVAVSAIWVNPYFAFCILSYILASRAYSSPQIRLKKYPYAGFLIVTVFQGAFTYYMSSWGLTGLPPEKSFATILVLLGCSFQIAGAYPLTQIYQHEQDLKDGVVTLSYKLGYQGTFLFTAIMFFFCNLFYFLYFREIEKGTIFYVMQIFFIPIIVYFVYWFRKVRKDVKEASFRNTMRMNLIAGICMNSCFLVLIFIRYYPLSYLTTLETAVPEHCFSQETLSRFYINATDDLLTKRKIAMVAARSGITRRYSVIGDYGRESPEFTFFEKDNTLLPEPGLSRRMLLYQEHAATLSMDAVKKIDGFDDMKAGITHLITVTCTGLSAPGLDIELIRMLGLKPSIHRSSVNFMGCNAAVIALKQADSICKSQKDARVLVVCTELCTIHFQKRFSDDYILSNLLFADGSAAVIVSSAPSSASKYSIKIDAFDSFIIHNGYRDMAWRLSETGFIMNLSSYVPDLIKKNIGPLFHSIKLDPDEIKHWAIHPGGKRIIDDFAMALGLDKCKVASSYQVLRDYGNMSSPTVLFVLKDIFQKVTTARAGERGLVAAFGPGLSIETMQFSYV